MTHAGNDKGGAQLGAAFVVSWATGPDPILFDDALFQELIDLLQIFVVK